MAWTLPRTWVSGEIVTAANMNTHVRDNLLAISGAWTTFTCTWSGTLGNGTKSAFYTRIGRTIHYRVTLVWGSSTSHAAANQTFLLPVAENANLSFVGAPFGIASAHDFSTGLIYMGWAVLNSGQTVVIQSSAFSASTFNSNTNPFTWAAGDILGIQGTYEAAAD